MISRRGFLQALLAIPAIAAAAPLLTLAKEVEALPAVDPVLDSSWITINGNPIQVKFVEWIGQEEYFDVWKEGWGRIPGLQTGRLKICSYMSGLASRVVSDLHHAQEQAVIEARFGPTIMTARGYITEQVLNVPHAEPVYHDIELRLISTEWNHGK